MSTKYKVKKIEVLKLDFHTRLQYQVITVHLNLNPHLAFISSLYTFNKWFKTLVVSRDECLLIYLTPPVKHP